MGRNIRTGAWMGGWVDGWMDGSMFQISGSHAKATPSRQTPTPNNPTGESERVGVYELGQFIVFTIADFCDQLMSWQVGRWGVVPYGGRLRLKQQLGPAAGW